MATPFKEYLSENHLLPFFSALKTVHAELDHQGLRQHIFDDSYENLELKERMRKISSELSHFLPKDFASSSEILLKASHLYVGSQDKLVGIELMFLPDFIEINGLEHFEISIVRMKEITKIMSCEFAVRPFIIKYGDQMMKVMYDWSKDENEHVRRLSSEGSRPRLPWAIALPEFKKDPDPVLPILEKLKTDTSEYVRRSVANNLNDIAKDHPDLAFEKRQRVDWNR